MFTPMVLTEQEWTEIYYALRSKLASPVVQGDAEWQGQLSGLIEKIGPDGRWACQQGTVSPMPFEQLQALAKDAGY